MPSADPRFAEIARYMQRISEAQGLRVRYEPRGDSISIREPSEPGARALSGAP